MKGELGVNHSAIEHGVPRTTLKDRLTGQVKHSTKPGPVVKFLFKCSSMEYEIT